jgi:hypothetical protein
VAVRCCRNVQELHIVVRDPVTPTNVIWWIHASEVSLAQERVCVLCTGIIIEKIIVSSSH